GDCTAPPGGPRPRRPDPTNPCDAPPPAGARIPLDVLPARGEIEHCPPPIGPDDPESHPCRQPPLASSAATPPTSPPGPRRAARSAASSSRRTAPPPSCIM